MKGSEGLFLGVLLLVTAGVAYLVFSVIGSQYGVQSLVRLLNVGLGVIAIMGASLTAVSVYRLTEPVRVASSLEPMSALDAEVLRYAKLLSKLEQAKAQGALSEDIYSRLREEYKKDLKEAILQSK